MGSIKNLIKFNTNQEKNDKIPGKPRILVAPLDWGLGHATRCIPVIQALLHLDCELWLAGEGPVERVLRAEFPQLPFLQLKGYNIHYSRSTGGFLGTMLRQFPKILSAIRHEHIWLKNQLKQYHFDAVISDNRFGLYNAAVPCVFITHQLRIKSFLGRWNENMLRWWNYRFINRFSQCWVPDFADANNLAGDLSHPAKKPVTPIYYLGAISRFKRWPVEEKSNHLLVILSGPEPQRSIFENMLIDQLVHYNGTVDFVRGLPSAETILPSTNQLHFYNHLSASEMNKKMMEAAWVISRSGYSTVMDLVQLQKRSILVPTPGQTEQQYLAHHLMEKGIAFCVKQEGFSLQKELRAANFFSYNIPATGEKKLEEIVRNFVSNLI